MKFRELKLRKNPDCPMCGKNPTITKLIDYEEFCGIRGQEEPAGNDIPSISVEELKKKMDAKADIFILDVREPHEYQICNLNGYLIPVGDLPKRVSELDSSREIIAHCKMGGRSAKAVNFLRRSGFKKVYNLTGGITAWAEKIDPENAEVLMRSFLTLVAIRRPFQITVICAYFPVISEMEAYASPDSQFITWRDDRYYDVPFHVCRREHFRP